MPVSEVVLRGGLNSDDSFLEVQPGECLQLHNYEVNTLGKYTRMSGFERIDGMPSPAETQYFAVSVDSVTGIAPQDTLVIDAAGQNFTGYVVGVDPFERIIGMTELSGNTVQVGMTIGGFAVAVSPSSGRGHPDIEIDEQWQILAEDRARSHIEKVPGGGPIRGAWLFDDVLYAFRDDADTSPTKCGIWKSTASGWVEVTAIEDHTGASTTLNPGGWYDDFKVDRFPDTSSELILVTAGGADKAIWFDGTKFTKINDFFSGVYPTSIEVLPSKILAMGYPNGSTMYSALNSAHDFDVSSGGAEIALGDPILGILVQPNESHVIFQRNKVHVIYGTSPADFRKTILSSRAGALPRTIQNYMEPMFVSDKGLTLLSRVQQFGDFEQANVTQRVERVMNAQRALITCAYSVGEKNQYRLCYEDGSGIIATFDNGAVVGFSTFDTGVKVVRVASTCKQNDGKERIFFGSDDGYVYEADKGNSFDGDEYTSVCRPAFNFIGNTKYRNPEMRKRFKKLMLEVRTRGISSIRLAPELDFDGVETPAHTVIDNRFIGPGGYWGEGIWGEFVWSAATVLQVEFYLTAVARNISPTFFSTSRVESPHTMNSLLVEYANRGSRR